MKNSVEDPKPPFLTHPGDSVYRLSGASCAAGGVWLWFSPRCASAGPAAGRAGSVEQI